MAASDDDTEQPRSHICMSPKVSVYCRQQAQIKRYSHSCVTSKDLVYCQSKIGQHKGHGAMRLATIEGRAKDDILIRLHKAATDGDDTELETLLLSTTVDQTGRTARDLINAGDQVGETALHKAARSANHRCRCVDILLRNGADVNAADKRGFRPLHEACEVGPRESRHGKRTVSEVDELATITVILKSGADVNAKMNLGDTALHLTRKVSIVSKLLEYGANPNTRNVIGRTPLHLSDNVAAARALCDAGADPNIKDEFGYTALHLVLTDPIVEMMQITDSLVMLMSEDPIIDMMKFLISRGANVNARNGLGLTPLHLACMATQNLSKNVTIPVLLDNGADCNITDVFGASPLYCLFSLFAKKGPDERPMLQYGGILEKLIRNSWNSRHSRSVVKGKTTLQMAAKNGWVPKDWKQKLKMEECNDLDAFSSALLEHTYEGQRQCHRKRADVPCSTRFINYPPVLTSLTSEPVPSIMEIVRENKEIAKFTPFGRFSLNDMGKPLVDTKCRKKPNDEWSRVESVANDDSLHSWMKDRMRRFVENIMSKVVNIDSRFQCRQLLVGSCYEGTRTKPNELDILLILSAFGDSLLTTESRDFPGFVSFKPRDTTSSLLEFCDSDGVLRTMLVKHKLYRLLIEAVSYPDAWGDESYELLSLSINKGLNSPAITLKVSVNRAWYDESDLDYDDDVSIDLVPVIPTDMTLPDNTPLSRYVSANCGSVDRRLLATMKSPKCSFGDTNNLWATSSVVVESEVLRSSAASVRKSYMMLKHFVLQMHDTALSQYALKSCVLHCIVNRMFDDIEHVDDLDESMKGCVRVILRRWWTCLVNDECPDVANPERYLPVWNKAPYAGFMKSYMSCYGVPYLTDEQRLDLKVSSLMQMKKYTCFGSIIKHPTVKNIQMVNYVLPLVRRLCEQFGIRADDVETSPADMSASRLRDVAMLDELCFDELASKFYGIHSVSSRYTFKSSHLKPCMNPVEL